MKTLKFIFSLSLVLLYTTVLFAEQVGTLTIQTGLLKLRRSQMDTIYTDPGISIPVENGDELQTGLKTRVIIQITDQSDTIELFANTFFTVTGISQEKSEVAMPTGKARFLVSKPVKMVKKQRRRFRLRTANAVIGVKGTEFVVGVLNGNTNLLTLSGIVSLASLSAPDIEVKVSPNQASKIRANRPPTVPVDVPPEIQQKIIESEDSESFEQVEFGDESEAADAEAGQGKELKSEDVEELEEVDEQDIDELIEEVNDEVQQIQEDVEEANTNRSIEFTIIDE
ncbi:MAG: FecR domain-containing protein [Deltaproteobacteria bacterium]|nr:FecR domain-containing protein [Deltaproteobacteria bacterium]MBT4267318.1 FecR domain-containing protein [Deltaproteobacteria bacterium]MBT4638211.1 FecR domain-containing protein [Deltaproteobacteria bacterium]MBT6501377.1 FecR domain-containing protein [Deltaproteobacteria bacterium]MBT6616248.1 FecR domain-containing protein [Deltaproteobacteria bacterium]